MSQCAGRFEGRLNPSRSHGQISVSVPRTHIEKSFSSIQDLVLLDSGRKDESVRRQVAG